MEVRQTDRFGRSFIEYGNRAGRRLGRDVDPTGVGRGYRTALRLEASRPCSSSDFSGQSVLCDGAPLLGVMAKDQCRPECGLNPHATHRCKLMLSVRSEWRQVFFDEGPAEVAAVTADDEGPHFRPDPDRLVTSRVTVGEQTGHGAVPEKVMIAGDLQAIVAMAEVAGVVRTATNHPIVIARCPLGGLDDDACVREFDQSPHVIEVKMRQHNLIHLARIEARRAQERSSSTGSVGGQMNPKHTIKRTESR